MSLCSTPLLAQADALVTNNDTNFDSTCVINDGSCSTVLGQVGVTKAHEQHHVIDASTVWFACIANRRNCKADVYMTNHCNDNNEPSVATVVFDVSSGIKSITMHDSNYAITAVAPFEITIAGGTSIAKK